MDWCWRNAAPASRTHCQDAESLQFSAGGPEKLTGADDPRHALEKNGHLADLWYMDDGDILCRLVLVPSYLHEFDEANDKVGAERNPQQTEVICYVADLDAAPPGCKIDEVRLLASVSTEAAGSKILGVAAGPRQFIEDQLLAKADVCQDPQTEFSLLRESLGVSRINRILRVHATRSCRGNKLLQSTMKLGNDPSRGSSLVSWRTVRNRRHTVRASRALGTNERGTLSAPHTLGHSLQPNRASSL